MEYIGYIYTCEDCGYEERRKGLYRGIVCPNCKSMMKRNSEKEQQELQAQRNKLNRQISTLKKETLEKQNQN